MDNRKVVVNQCYGGFSLSPEAVKRLWELKHPGEPLYFYKKDWGTGLYTRIDDIEGESNFDLDTFDKDLGKEFKESRDTVNEHFIWLDDKYPRHDPDLVRVVEELGSERASGRCSELEVIDIGNKKYHIDEYDGYETLITELSDNYWL